ncbi:MAG: YeeE/YedE family protein [Bryobacterales bacterium]|nr:YeeE/YedE family protein [Bryobacterales bacterium]
MTTDAPLNFEAMSQRMIKKHHVAIILLHWFNAITWLMELTTGAALIVSPNYRFMPVWFVEMITEVFGSRGNLLRFHIAAGLLWVTVFAVYGIFGWRTYLHREVLEREVALDRDDLQWLRIRVLSILGRSNEPLPPQGVYNAGQKMFALMVYAMLPIIMVTGLIMAFHWGSAAVVGWAVVVHFATVAVVVSGLMVHVYMGAVFPEEKPAFFSMLTGMVPELFAYKHHHKWWLEVKAMESTPAQPAAPTESTLSRWLHMKEYWPAYWAGLGLGLTLLATFLIIGQGLGASGGFTRYLAFTLSLIAPQYAATHPYWGNYVQPGQPVLMDFLVFELIGVVIGGFVSGWLAGRFKISTDHGPRITPRTRWALAFAGGAISGVGARMARGCTSGLALSGGAVLSAGAFAFMLAVFAAGFLGAYFLRKVWL